MTRELIWMILKNRETLECIRRAAISTILGRSKRQHDFRGEFKCFGFADELRHVVVLPTEGSSNPGLVYVGINSLPLRSARAVCAHSESFPTAMDERQEAQRTHGLHKSVQYIHGCGQRMVLLSDVNAVRSQSDFNPPKFI